MARSILLSYADARFQDGLARLRASALEAGFDEVIAAGPADVADTPFFRQNRAILRQARGGGYWLWKPFLIREHLARLQDGDVLFYCDASEDGFYAFDRFPQALIERARDSYHGFVIGPVLHQHGALSRWAKRDALVLLNADRPDIVARPLLQATWNAWRPTREAIELIDAWLLACTDPRILTDQPNQLGLPNYHDFIDHRHDQTVLSLIAYRDSLPVLDLKDTGIFDVMAWRPESEMTHRFLKAPGNADRMLRGDNPMLSYASAAIRQAATRRLGFRR